jgi:hypothetical protein
MFDEFYTIEDENIILALLRDAKDKAFNVHLDELECSSSFERYESKKTFEEILKIWEESEFRHFVFIVRNRKMFDFNNNQPYIETGTRSNKRGEGKDYFLFIYIPLEFLYYFVTKYKLKRME